MILTGTSGFSYDDWKGCFYPESIAKKDMLDYYARRFKTTEINSSYYTIPGAASFAGMAKKTPDDFEFVVKAHKDMTHGEELQPEIFDIFRGSIQPLINAGKFGCMLAQFPWSFRHNDENIGKLREFREMAGDLPTVIEFRNAEWVSDETFDLLRELDFGFCSVDEPHLKGLMPPVAAATSNIGYVRFHGRNAKKWFRHEEAHERYDYLYSEEELQPWVPKVRDIESNTSKTYVFFNNHYRGKSAINAQMFAKLLGLDLPAAESVQPAGPGALPF